MLVVGLALFLGLPSMRGFHEGTKDREATEKRTLAPFPNFTAESLFSSAFFSELDLYLSDHFGYSEKLHRFHQSIVYFVFRDDPVPNVTLGLDGFVFLNSHSREHPYSVLRSLCVRSGRGEDFSLARSNWPAVLDEMEGRGYRSVLAVVPSKPVIYPEKLPRRVPKQLRQACGSYGDSSNTLARLSESAARQRWAIYYPFGAFSASRYKGNFFPKENFHWIGASVHLFVLGLLDTLSIVPADAYSADPVDREVAAELSRILGVRLKAEIRDYDYHRFGVTEKPGEPIFVKEWYSRALNFREAVTARPMTARTALVISNSFGTFSVKHLAPAYKRVVQVDVNHLLPREGKAFIDGFVRRVAPDDVIFLFHDDDIASAGERLHGYLSGEK